MVRLPPAEKLSLALRKNGMETLFHHCRSYFSSHT